jgi:hypothetical protein
MGRRQHECADGDRRHHRGVILIVTLVILVILATLGYTLTARVAARRHRDQYIIDYGQARYACASALKYALTVLPQLEYPLISRPNEPDFSDVFAMSEVEYQELLACFAQIRAEAKENSERAGTAGDANDMGDVNDMGDANDLSAAIAELLTVPGPYGPPWPLVTAPLECEIGSAQVTIEIEDENAKYPLNWALIADEQWKPLADVGFVTFCEWMGYSADDVSALQDDLAKIAGIRSYQLEFKPQAVAPVRPPANLRSRVAPRTSATAARRPATRPVVPVPDPAEQQTADFAKFFHSSLIDADRFRRPSIESDSRNESAMKYLGLWATRQVNINTAPRQVLEAALMFGSPANAPKIAQAIIVQRQIKPFADIEEVKRTVFQYSDAVEKCKSFLTTTSSVLTVRVTAVSGVATATMIAAVNKEGDKIKQIGVVSD